MASPTTAISTHASHAVIFELRIRSLLGTVPFANYLHVAIERDGSWDTGQPSPTFFEVIDGIWDEWDDPFLALVGNDVVLNKLRLSEVLDYANVGGQPSPVYGPFCELTDFTGITGFTEGDLGGGQEYFPSMVSVYCLKQKDASPRNINGSLRLGPTIEGYTDQPATNRLNNTAKTAYQTAVNGLLTPRAITAADGGNIANCTMVIMQKTPAVGMAAPWDFVAVPDRIKVRFGLGTQNTRKKTRNTYT